MVEVGRGYAPAALTPPEPHEQLSRPNDRPSAKSNFVSAMTPAPLRCAGVGGGAVGSLPMLVRRHALAALLRVGTAPAPLQRTCKTLDYGSGIDPDFQSTRRVANMMTARMTNRPMEPTSRA